MYVPPQVDTVSYLQSPGSLAHKIVRRAKPMSVGNDICALLKTAHR